jgi:hypothetical protein
VTRTYNDIATPLATDPLPAEVLDAVRRLIADQPDAPTLAEALGVTA